MSGCVHEAMNASRMDGWIECGAPRAANTSKSTDRPAHRCSQSVSQSDGEGEAKQTDRQTEMAASH